MKRLICTAFLGLKMSVGAQAALVTFDLTAGFGAANPETYAQLESAMGVTYTANLQLDGSNTIVTDLNGTGIAFGATNRLNTGESILFNAANATGEVGGTAVFNGFRTVTFTEFDAGDTANVNGVAVSADGVHDLTVGGTVAAPTSFSVIGTGDASATSAGFQISQVVADFTIVPTAVGVPEPSSFAALLLIGGMAVNRRRRRK